MSLDFDPSDDLTTIGDGLEPVRLLRPGSSDPQGTLIPHALRRAITAGQAAIISRGDVRKTVASGGRYRAADLVWHLPVDELPVAPRLGDMILDGDGRRWTIITVKKATLGSRWRCETREVVITPSLDDTISILKAVVPSGGGEAVWRVWLSGIRARIQPIERKIVADAEPPYTVVRYRIFVAQDLALDHTCRIRGPDGTLYNITGAVGGGRIGELQVIEAEVEQ